MKELPLFPLGVTLFPQGLLPLQIFEVRYLDMIGKCHRGGTPFGVVSLVTGSEVERAGPGPGRTEQFVSVGTLAEIRQLTNPQAGLLQIETCGTQRFRLHDPRRLPHGLWVADAELLANDPVLSIPADLQDTADRLGALIRRLQEAGVTPDQMPFLPPYHLDDCGWVANRWGEILPTPPTVRQTLLAEDNPLIRLELISDLLDELPDGVAER